MRQVDPGRAPRRLAAKRGRRGDHRQRTGAQCQSLRSGATDRFESRPGLAQRTVAAFEKVVGIEGDRVVRIDGRLDANQVEARSRQEVADVLR